LVTSDVKFPAGCRSLFTALKAIVNTVHQLDNLHMEKQIIEVGSIDNRFSVSRHLHPARNTA
jgi:hypothetical protein